MRQKYIDAEKLKAEIKRREKVHFDDYHLKKTGTVADYGACNALCQIRSYIETLQQERPKVDLSSKVTFDCIGKKVTMSVQELINYYIDKECCDVADECGF